MAQRDESGLKTLYGHLARWDARLRFSLLFLWIPRGIALGAVIGLAAALYARIRPSLLPEQIAAVALLAVVLGGTGAFLVVWFIPRPPIRAARYFDRVFGLKERTSTALEVAMGKTPAPGGFDVLQSHDALEAAAQVNPRQGLPIRLARRELATMALLLVLLVITFLFANPQTEALARQQAIDSAIEEQLEKLREVKREIEANPALSEEEKRQLSELIDSAADKLEQPEITQPEAVAELNKTAEKIRNERAALERRQQEAAAESGAALNQSAATQGAGEALQQGKLSEAAEEMNNLAERIADQQLTPEQQQEAAEALENAARAMENLNPEAAEALREAAEALKRGDAQAAAEALKRAAEALNKQQEALEQDPLSQAAQDAAEKLNESGKEVAQAGGNQSSQSPTERQEGGEPKGQPGSNGSPSENPQEGAEGQPQPGQQPSDGAGGDEAEIFDGNEGRDSGGESGSESSSGAPNSGKAGEGQDPNQGQAGAVEGEDGGGAGAGTGSGGSGKDVTSGDPNAEKIDPNNKRGDGRLANNDFIYAPSFTGGEGGNELGVDGQGKPGESDPNQTGDFSENPTGESKVKVGSVVGEAAKQADEALETDRVPGALRGIVRQYFTGLQQ